MPLLHIAMSALLASPIALAPAAPWKVSFGRSGGIGGHIRSIELSDDGKVVTRDRAEVTFQAPKARLDEVNALLRQFQAAGAPLPASAHRKPIPDGWNTDFQITYAGHKYSIDLDAAPVLAEPLAKLVPILGSLLEEGLRRAAEESEWAKAVPFDPGRVWHVNEEVRGARGSEWWEATWTRRGKSSTFDGVWRNLDTRREVRGVVVLHSAARGQLDLTRTGTKDRYSGTYSPVDPSRPNGTRSLSGEYWDAWIEH